VPLPEDAAEDSVSFSALLTAPDTPQVRRAPLIHHAAQGRFAIRSGDWKLVMPHRTAAAELYNLSSDPSETTDVAAAHPEHVARLTAEITAIIMNGRTRSGRPQPNDQPWWDDLTWIPKPTE